MRAEAALALPIAALTLSACAPETPPEPTFADLDCAQPFDAQSAKLVAQPHLTPAPAQEGLPYDFYSSEDGHVSYLITKPGAPAHPAIMMQRAMHDDVKTTGCPYGSRPGYEQLMVYLDSLKTWTRKGRTQK